MDSTWGAGHLGGGDKYVKHLNEFYFCAVPERIIVTHHPDEDKWQLIYPPVSLEEYGRLVKYDTSFYDYFTTDIKYQTLKTKSQFTIRFDKKNEKDNLDTIVEIKDKYGNSTKNALCLPRYYKNYIEFFYIFKKKGTYKTTIFAGLRKTKSYSYIVDYNLQCTEDFKVTADTPFSLPEVYSNEIVIIEPIFNILKKGKKITFKCRCDDAEEICITNDEWLTVKKNEEGIFEKTITVKTNQVSIGKKSGNTFTPTICYEI